MSVVEKKNYKNKLWYGSKLSQYKLEKVLRCFADNKTVAETSEITNISTTTIKKCFFNFRIKMFYASIAYRNLFNGAGLLLMLGSPHNAWQAEKLANEKRQGKSKHTNWFFWEILIRTYSSYRYSKAELAVVSFFALARFAVFHGILIKEYEIFPEELELLPKNPKQKMSFLEFEASSYVQENMNNVIRELWRAIIRKEFEVPKFIWAYLFSGRGQVFCNDTIYRDLRWYLLKHPIKGDRRSISPTSSDIRVPAREDYKDELIKLIQMAKAVKENPDLYSDDCAKS